MNRRGDNHPQKELAKFGNRSKRQINQIYESCYKLVPFATYCLNMTISRKKSRCCLNMAVSKDNNPWNLATLALCFFTKMGCIWVALRKKRRSRKCWDWVHWASGNMLRIRSPSWFITPSYHHHDSSPQVTLMDGSPQIIFLHCSLAQTHKDGVLRQRIPWPTSSRLWLDGPIADWAETCCSWQLMLSISI